MIKELTSRALFAGALLGLAMAAAPVHAGQSGNHLGVEEAAIAAAPVIAGQNRQHLGVEEAAMAKPKPKPKPKPRTNPPPPTPRSGQNCIWRIWGLICS